MDPLICIIRKICRVDRDIINKIIEIIRVIGLSADTGSAYCQVRAFGHHQFYIIKTVHIVKNAWYVTIDKQVASVILLHKYCGTSFIIDSGIRMKGQGIPIFDIYAFDQHDAGTCDLKGTVSFQLSDPVDPCNSQSYYTFVRAYLSFAAVVINHGYILSGNIFPALAICPVR